MLKLDHIAIIAPSLDIGIAHVREQLGLEMQEGGKHCQMGTHNLLLRLGEDIFLEVIAVDPEATPPNQPRWFGMDDSASIRTCWETGARLRAWVARTNDLDAVLACHSAMLGSKIRVSRGDRDWLFSLPLDGALPHGGLAPSVIDWGLRGCPAVSMPDLGARLVAFTLEHPRPNEVLTLYETLGVIDPPRVRAGARPRYIAQIETPSGMRELW
jgi:hypothetical protein